MYFLEKTKAISFVKQFDYILFFAVLTLSVSGVVVLRSAVLTLPSGDSMLNTQIVSIILGIIAAVIIALFDYRQFKTVGFVIYIICLLLLVYVLKWGIGYESYGSSSWIYIPGLTSFQPSEIMKISYVIIGSLFLERLREGNEQLRDFIKFLFYVGLPVILILLQPDYGMVIVYLSGLLVMIFVFGIKYKYIFLSVAGLLSSFPFVWKYALNEPRKLRIIEFLRPGSDPSGASWQLDRAEIAIGSGRVFGSGLFKGIQTQSSYVPVKESDLIFSVIGEELGFVGALFFVILILFIILRCVYIARNSSDFFGSYIVMGITGMLGFQFIQNIGMSIRLIPVTGLPLPFVSAGGSAMVTNFVLIGVVLSVSLRRKRPVFVNSK